MTSKQLYIPKQKTKKKNKNRKLFGVQSASSVNSLAQQLNRSTLIGQSGEKAA